NEKTTKIRFHVYESVPSERANVTAKKEEEDKTVVADSLTITSPSMQ
ncbi:hypothetical protein CCACVL1_12417, partial [Corchorus capsularis]